MLQFWLVIEHKSSINLRKEEIRLHQKQKSKSSESIIMVTIPSSKAINFARVSTLFTFSTFRQAEIYRFHGILVFLNSI